MRALSANDLRGVWAAIPTPWNSDYRIDTSALEENIRRCEMWGVSGVYTTDSDGEFYAIELSEFRELVRTFGRAMEKTSLDAAVGVTWCNTTGIIDRIKVALDAGIPNIHVAFPFWMPLAKPDVPRFFEDLAEAVPESRWIHYRTPRAHIAPSGIEYAHYQAMYPNQFIGTKLGTTDFVDIVEVIGNAPALAHFGFEDNAIPAALLGGRGNYSYWVIVLPKWTLKTWELAERGLWKEAMDRQKKLICWESQSTKLLVARGHNHAILGKARASFTGAIIDSGLTRAPYNPADAGLIQQLKSQFQSFWAQEMAEEQNLACGGDHL